MPTPPVFRVPVRFSVLALSAASLTLLTAGSAQTNNGQATNSQATDQLPAGWTAERLSTATYLILEPQVQGNVNLVSGGEQQAVMRALKKDSGDALKRRYPRATIVRDEAASPADAIRVTPGLTAPSALLPWAKMSASMTFTLPDGPRVEVNRQFTVLDLWQRRHDAANFAYDQVALRLP